MMIFFFFFIGYKNGIFLLRILSLFVSFAAAKSFSPISTPRRIGLGLRPATAENLRNRRRIGFKPPPTIEELDAELKRQLAAIRLSNEINRNKNIQIYTIFSSFLLLFSFI